MRARRDPIIRYFTVGGAGFASEDYIIILILDVDGGNVNILIFGNRND